MRVGLTVFILLLAAGFVSAQSMMPLPVYGSTYSAAAVTRGFYFQAPRAFTITGLRVPNEKNVLQAGVAVYVRSTPPPAWPKTGTGGMWLYKGYFLASKVQSCSIPVKKGEWVGVLGACGDRNIAHNSYAAKAGPFQSSVAGLVTTLRGFGTQTNVMPAQGAGAYYADDNGTIARVEVYVNVWAASLGGPNTGAPGVPVGINLQARSDAGLPYQIGTSLGKAPIRIDKRQLYLTPDELLKVSVLGLLPTVFMRYAGTIDAGGMGWATIGIPKIPALKGVVLHSAFVTLAPSAPSGIASISNTHSILIQ